MENINVYTSLDECKDPPKLEVGKNPASERSPTSENCGSKAKNNFAMEIEAPEDESTDESSPLGMQCLT